MVRHRLLPHSWKLWLPHSWRCSRPHWMGLWASEVCFPSSEWPFLAVQLNLFQPTCAHSLKFKITWFLQFDLSYSERTEMGFSLLCDLSLGLLTPPSRMLTSCFFSEGHHPHVTPEELGVTSSYKKIFWPSSEGLVDITVILTQMQIASRTAFYSTACPLT